LLTRDKKALQQASFAICNWYPALEAVILCSICADPAMHPILQSLALLSWTFWLSFAAASAALFYAIWLLIFAYEVVSHGCFATSPLLLPPQSIAAINSAAALMIC